MGLANSSLRCSLLALMGMFSMVSPTRSADTIEGMIQVRLGADLVEGRPLHWTSQQISLLSRDGSWVRFRPSKAKDFHQTSPQFSSYPIGELRARLYSEFGRDFDVTGTGHYLVVHPRGQKDRWAQRFEDLYRSFLHYFQVRGLRPSEPKFPLVAVVFKSRSDYQRYSASIGAKISPSYLGHYSPVTNRTYLYDSTTPNSKDWSLNAETIIHEATHQTAYNTGVHNRFAATPRWVSEGLATMFETPGVWNSSRHRAAKDRINRDQLRQFQHHAKHRKMGWLKALVISDVPFRVNSAGAYAESWALSYYLCETRARKYTEFLSRTARRPSFENYTPSQRLRDFTDTFGEDLEQFEVQFLRYMARVK